MKAIKHPKVGNLLGDAQDEQCQWKNELCQNEQDEQCQKRRIKYEGG